MLVRRTRPGRWAYRRARARRRELSREYRRLFAIGAGVSLLALAASVVVAVQIGYAFLAWFIAGAFYGAALMLWVTVFELVDPVTRHWIQGAQGEELTGHELDRCRKQGWRIVHNLHLEPGDIDHIAIGPGGVLAFETKLPAADWTWLARGNQPREWADQANKSAQRTRALILQHTGLPVEVRPVVVVWARGLVDAEPVRVARIRFVHGTELADRIGRLPAVMTGGEVQQIYAALDRVARQREQAKSASVRDENGLTRSLRGAHS